METLKDSRPTVLVVDNDGGMSTMCELCLSHIATIIPALGLIQARRALSEKAITHIITSELEGDWEEVIEAAQKARVENIVVVTKEKIGRRVSELGANYISTCDIADRTIRESDLLLISEGANV